MTTARGTPHIVVYHMSVSLWVTGFLDHREALGLALRGLLQIGVKVGGWRNSSTMRFSSMPPFVSFRHSRYILRWPKHVRFCTGKSTNLVEVICPIYLLFLTTQFDYSVFWPNYPQKCMIFLQQSSHKFCHFTHFSVKSTIFWGVSGYKTLLFVVVLSLLLFFAHLKIQFLRRRFPKCCKSTTLSDSYCEASQYET